MCIHSNKSTFRDRFSQTIQLLSWLTGFNLTLILRLLICYYPRTEDNIKAAVNMVKKLKVALIINPIAGIGGSLAMKGSDGMAEIALKQGAVPRAALRVEQALREHLSEWSHVEWYAAKGSMGGDLLDQLTIDWQDMDFTISTPTTAADTIFLSEKALQLNVDLVLFAGGDGTARDICSAIEDKVPVLGIPAGVKIHSSVYAVTPHAAGEVLSLMVKGALVDVRNQEVRDIDEEAFRNNQVRASLFGEMKVPDEGHFIQHTKSGGVEDEQLVIFDIADYLIEEMDPEVTYLIGSGKTTAMIMDNMALPNTLLGIDAIQNGHLIASDLNESEILTLMDKSAEVRVIITAIGGQGHVLGRGNQQLSPKVISRLKKEQIQVIATKGKLTRLEGRALILDSGDPVLDARLSGYWEIITGYNDRVLYPVRTY